MDGQFDVIVLGGGPAGTAAALTLLRYSNLSVAVIEKSGYDDFRIGESLSPGVMPLLEYLGVDDVLPRHQASFGIRAAWGSDVMQTRDFMYTVHGQGWSLDRLRFDRMLADAVVANGGVLLTGARPERINRTPEGWNIEAVDRAIKTRFCIDTTGKIASFARRQGAQRLMYDQLVGVARVGKTTLEDTFTEIEACEDGWWYSAKLPNSRVIFVCLSDADLIKRDRLAHAAPWLTKLRATTHLARRLKHCRLTDPICLFAAHTAHLDCMYGEQWIAAGDAVASYDPLSARGIPGALDSGIQAARAAHGLLTGNVDMPAAYATGVMHSFQDYLGTRTRYYQMEQRFPTSVFWRRRQAIIQLNSMSLLVAAMDFQPLSLHLSRREYNTLYRLCKQPRLAHQIVTAFKETVRAAVPDQRIILGLQDLVDQGIVRVLQ